MHSQNTSAGGARVAITTGRASVPITQGNLASYYVGREYVRAVIRAGGVPLLAPATDERVELVVEETLGLADALLLPGGCDLAPSLYGGPAELAVDADPVRDTFELAMLAGAVEREIPVLGICRGMQLINVSRGGSLSNGDGHAAAEAVEVAALGEVRVHRVQVDRGTLAHAALGEDSALASCAHHQVVDRVGEGLVASVRSREGAVEAVEDRERRVLGILWHPELGLDRTDTDQRIYDWLVREAERSPAAVAAAGGAA